MASLLGLRRRPAATFNGWPLAETFTTWQPDGKEPVGRDFELQVSDAYKRNGIVFACVLARGLAFSEARFQFRRYQGGRPSELFGGPELAPLERPWAGGTTGELLWRMEQDASLAGNAFIYRRPDGALKRLRPDWVTIVGGSPQDASSHPDDLDAEVIAYLYHPGGRQARRGVRVLTPSEVAHYSPIPDPGRHFAGMSWLTPVIEEVDSDSAMTRHKSRFFDYAATPNMIVKLQQSIGKDEFERLRSQLHARHGGADNAYKTMLLEGGADVTVVGSSFEQMSFKTTQGAGETRIAAAAGVPPIIPGFSEGLGAATYSNYGQARRRFADMTIRPLWRIAAASLEQIITTPTGAHLWYDDRDIAFLREDARDEADIFAVDIAAVRSAVDSGFTPESATLAVEARNLSLLVHTGLTSVQLQADAQAQKASSDAGT